MGAVVGGPWRGLGATNWGGLGPWVGSGGSGTFRAPRPAGSHVAVSGPECGPIRYPGVMPDWNIRFPDDVLAALKKAAVEDTRSLNGEVVAVLRGHLTERGLLPPTDTTDQ